MTPKKLASISSAAAFFVLTAQLAIAAPQSIFLDTPSDYEWHASNLKALGYDVVPFKSMTGPGGVVLRVVGKLTDVPFPEGRFGGYSVAADLSYRCTMDTKDLVGQATAEIGPIVVNNYPYVSYSGKLNDEAFRSTATSVYKKAIESSDALNKDESICKKLNFSDSASAPKAKRK